MTLACLSPLRRCGRVSGVGTYRRAWIGCAYFTTTAQRPGR
jgi:hypothetical protein